MTLSEKQRAGMIELEGTRGNLQGGEQVLTETRRLAPVEAKALLDQRARDLARVIDSDEQAGDKIEVVTFALSSERYAIEVCSIFEVERFAEFTPVPGAPGHLLGVTNLNGEILAIFDLRELFGIPQRAISDLFRVIVLGDERPQFGVLADAVDEVRLIAVTELRSPPAQLPAGELVRGVTEDALILLDGGALLADNRFVIDHT